MCIADSFFSSQAAAHRKMQSTETARTSPTTRQWWMQNKAMVRDMPTLCEERICADSNTKYAVLMHIISQLRPGADLSRVTLPTFILEPRSMLERITK